VSAEKNHSVHTTHTQHMCPATRIIGGKAMGATGWYAHGAGHPRQAVEAPAGQPNPRPPRTRAMAGSTSYQRVLAHVGVMWCETQLCPKS
jgi:hypothetical protein